MQNPNTILKRQLIRMHGLVCTWCKMRTSRDDLTLDHVVPVCLGGKEVTLACRTCNESRGYLQDYQCKLRELRELPRGSRRKDAKYFAMRRTLLAKLPDMLSLQATWVARELASIGHSPTSSMELQL